MRIVASLLLCFFVFGVGTAPIQAQLLPAAEELSITLSPEYPRPYDTVTIRVDSTLVDLAASTIQILVNGKVVAENSRTASFTMGAPGTRSTITVRAKDDAGLHQAQMVVSGADVALVVEPTSTVPPFYLGARLVAPEGSVRIIALPDFQNANGTKIPPQNLSYTWKFGDRILQNESGIGKNILSARAPVRYRDAQITLTVTTQDKSLVAEATTRVSPVDPLVRVYTNDPLRGINFATALSGTRSLSGEEESYRAVPYFFRTTPTIQWTLNGTPSDTDPNLTVRTTGTTKGTAVLGVTASEKGTFNSAENRFTIQFGEGKSTGIFGL